MYYAKIDKCEYTNGTGCGISLYVSGCHFHCKGCFNKETWDFNYGKEWNKNSIEELFNYFSDEKFIKRFSVLGGEPLADENIETVFDIVKAIKNKFPYIEIWIYTGYDINTILKTNDKKINDKKEIYKYDILTKFADYVIDGQFEIDKKDITLKFRGSTNQRLLNHNDILNIVNIINADANEDLVNCGYDGIIMFNNFSYDSAIIGVSTDDRVIYDYCKMIEWLMVTQHWTEEEAVEWIDYNTFRAIPYMGEKAPIIFYPLDR